jgi:hypothetical protein
MTTSSATFIPRARLVEMLASSVGNEKGKALVDEALAGVAAADATLIPTSVAQAALARVAQRGGAVGAAARLAAARLGVSGAQTGASSSSSIDLAAQLSSALGVERASEQVAAVCKRLALDPTRLSREQAIRALEALGAEAGLVGISARFTKARLLLSA